MRARGDLSPSGSLVLRVVETVSKGEQGIGFLLRRVRREMTEAADPDERRYLSAVLTAMVPCDPDYGSDAAPEAVGASLPDALVIWAGHLERSGRVPGAARVLASALRLRPACPEVKLHAARVARKNGHMAGARSLYRAVGEHESAGRLFRTAEVGLALLDEDARGALGRALRAAVRDGDPEAAAVAQEERANVRRRGGDPSGALRDYAAACVRFTDPVDRGRVLHATADVLVAAGDPSAAREVLLKIEGLAAPAQVDRAHARLREISRSLGDELGMRRWRAGGRPGTRGSAGPTALVSISGTAVSTEARSRRAAVRRAFRRLGANSGSRPDPDPRSIARATT